MIAFYIAIFTINIYGQLALITSQHPVFSAISISCTRQTSGLQIYEVILSSLISIVMVAVLIWIAIKTYKDSVLTFERGLFILMKRVFKKIKLMSYIYLSYKMMMKACYSYFFIFSYRIMSKKCTI